MKHATIPCCRCGGTGQVEFNGVYADTMKLLKSMREPTNGATLARLFGCTNMAMCNRLVVLEKYGFATSKRYGRDRLWSAA